MADADVNVTNNNNTGEGMSNTSTSASGSSNATGNVPTSDDRSAATFPFSSFYVPWQFSYTPFSF